MLFISLSQETGRKCFCFVMQKKVDNRKYILLFITPGSTLTISSSRSFSCNTYFTGRNFRVFAFFTHFRETKSPRKGMTIPRKMCFTRKKSNNFAEMTILSENQQKSYREYLQFAKVFST